MNTNTPVGTACAPARVTLRRPAFLLSTALLATFLVAGCGGGAAPAPRTPPTDGGGTGQLPGDGGSTPPPAGGVGTGKVTLKWASPTYNEDGSALTDLAGYHVYYGQKPGVWDKTLNVPASVASVEIRGLAAGSWYFSISSYNTAGIESARSGVVGTRI